MTTRTLSIRGVPDALLRSLRAEAERNRRSLNAELLGVLERAAGQPPTSIGEPVAKAYTTRGTRTRSVVAIDRAAVAKICRRHHIRRLAVFGSVARGDDQPGSDLDVVVDFTEGMTPGLGFDTVARDLQAALGGRPVDLVTTRGLSPRMRASVQASEKVLYEG